MTEEGVYFARTLGEATYLPTVEQFYTGIREEHFEVNLGYTDDEAPTTMEVLQCFWGEGNGSATDDDMLGGPEITLTPRHVAIIIRAAKQWLGTKQIRELIKEEFGEKQNSV